MVHKEYEEKEFKEKLQEIVGLFDWFVLEECQRCKKTVKISIFDGECPGCRKEVISGDLYPEVCEVYEELLIEAIRGSMEEKINARGDYRSHYIRLCTSLEVFLQQVAEEQMRKKHTDEKIISFIFDTIRPDVRTYFDLLKCLDVKVEKKDREKEDEIKKGLWKVRDIRNKVVHKAHHPSEDELLEAIEKIVNFFYIFHKYSIFNEKRRIKSEWV